MTRENGGTNGATGRSYRSLMEGVAAAQARNMEFVLGWIGGSVKMLGSQAEIGLRMMETVAEQTRKQQEVSRALVEGAVKTFAGLSQAPLVHEAGADRNGRSLPIDDYDRLSVGEISSRLGRLTAREVEELKAYEKRHKNRVTLLERLDRALV